MTSEPTAARPATVATALAAPAVAEVALDAELLRHPLGAAATFLQFSSGFCAPCRATRRVLERVVATSEGVAHVEVDVAHRGDLAGAFDVTVTPTVVVLDAHGVPVGRVEGAPSLAQARATLTALLARPDRSEPDPDPEPEPVRRARVVVPSAGGAGRAVGA